MPGKPDSHTQATAAGLGVYVPGSKEYKAWDDGWRYRYTGTQTTAPITNNPFSAAQSPAEKAAWDNGWNEASANTAGAQRMPATTGAPAVDPP